MSNPESSPGPVVRPDLLAGEQLPPAPQQKRSRDKREALLQAALAHFAEHGYEESTVEEIARHAGVAVGGFYQHFSSKRQLLLVLMDQFLRDASTLLEQAQQMELHDIRIAISALVRMGLQIDWGYTGAYRAWREAVVLDRQLRQLHSQIERWAAQLLEAMFHGLLELPGARKDVDVKLLAWEISLLFWRLIEEPLEDAAEHEAIIASLTQLIYHGLFHD